MDIYSSDRKLSELSMLSNHHHHHQQPPLDRHQDFSPSATSSASSTTMTAYSGSQDFDGGSTFGADVLDFFDSDFGPLNSDSLKVYEEGFESALTPQDDEDNNNMVNDNNSWLEFLNPPVSGDPRADIYLHEDGLDFLDGSRIKTEEHSYSLVKDDELTEFKLNFEGDLELFQPAGMMEEGEEADDSLTTGSESNNKVKLDADGIDEYLFEPDCLALTDHHSGASQPEDVNQLLGVVVPESLPVLPLVSTSLLNSSHQSKQLTVPKRKSTLAVAGAGGGTDFLMSLCTVKTEPADYMSQDEMNYSGNIIDGLDEGTMPPTPPSSGCGLNSDSECSNGEMSGPPSPPTGSRGITKQQDHHHGSGRHQQPFFSNPIPSSGILILSEEEKRTLLAEGYSLPSKLPLSKQEEKNLKKIRRKIKNKISAQESRRKKKEYLESLEKKVDQITQENTNLKKRINLLESNNRSLITELQKLQSLANKVMKSSSLSSSSSSSSSFLSTLSTST